MQDKTLSKRHCRCCNDVVLGGGIKDAWPGGVKASVSG